MKYKMFALCLIVASVLALAGNALHPRDAAETKPIAHLTSHLMNEHQSQWYFAHGMLLVMVPLMLLGYLGLYWYLREKRKDSLSVVGFVLISMWAILSLFVFILDGFVGPIFAEKSLSIFEYNYYLSLVLTAVSFLLYGPALAFLGLSALYSKALNKWLAISGVLLGAIAIVGYPLGLFGVYWVYSSIFPVYAASTTVWSLLVGVNMLLAKRR